MSPVFVGRDGESAVLAAALERVREGAPGTVLIGGEAGVGKSRLVAEFTTPLPETVLTGRCLELGENGLAFAPFTAVLRSLVREIGADGVQKLMPRGEVGELCRLHPALGPLEPHWPGGPRGVVPPHRFEPGAVPPTMARARLFEEFLTLLAGLAERGPAVLVIEDLHWADRSSRELLAFLVRNQEAVPGLLTIATYRTDRLGPPLRPLLAELDRTAWTERIELGRLPRSAVAAQLRGLLGHEPDARLGEEIFRRSEGNPLFVEVLSARAGAPVPASIRDLLVGPAEPLPAATQRVVRAAAAGGERVGHALLSAVTGLGDAELSDALRPALRANLLLVEGDVYVFRHALIREVLYEDVLPGERIPLHERYAEALEKDPSLVPPGCAAVQTAHHWHVARRHPERALNAAWCAAAEARESLAYSEQLQMLLQVLDLWKDAPEQIGASHSDVLEEAVRAAMASGEGPEAMRLIARALGENSDAAREGRLLAYRGELRHALGLPGDLTDLREAARIVPRGHRSRASVLNILANRMLTIPRDDEGLAAAEEAVAAAQAAGDRTMATINLEYARARSGDLDERLPRFAAARETAHRLGDEHALLHAYRCEADLLIGVGRYERAAATARYGLATATRAGLVRTAGPTHAGNLAESLIALGRWDEAVETLEHALDLAPTPSLRAYLRTLRGTVALGRGDLDLAQSTAAYARDVFGRGTSYAQDYLLLVRLEADLLIARDRRAEAARLVERELAVVDFASSPRYFWPVLAAGAGAGAEGLEPVAAALPADGPVQRAHRLCFTAETGRPDLWCRVADAWCELEQPYPRAIALLHAAERAAEEGDRAASTRHLRTAAALAEALDAAPLVEWAGRLAKVTRVSVRDEPDAHDRPRFDLTPREREVLRLVADGHTNRQIAEELFISVKTAGGHVSNILAKLGVTGRVQAATAAHRHRLL
ncbi:ATP-binding protein [Spirillospora sp. CA-294931]|uniref:ATP-binding protein n=1 Tax=Spirillospora sp. CA-294931 TaxID=3240042 RepID=UPI003D8D6F2E